MSVAYLALGAGIVVAIAYLAVIYRGFRKIQSRDGGLRRRATRRSDTHRRPSIQRTRGRHHLEIGVGIDSVGRNPVALTVNANIWYAVPFLGLGTSLAVILAFILDKDDVLTSA
jgi:hypothetical protein